MTIKEIKALSDTDLLIHCIAIEVSITKQVNSSRGRITKESTKLETHLFDEIATRFDLDRGALETYLNE